MPESMDKQDFACAELPCKSVVVYSDRAEVKRLCKLSLQPGQTDVKVTGLPESIDSSSVRVDGRGQATICEVQYNEKWVAADEATMEARRKEMHKKIEELEANKAKIEDELNAVDGQLIVLEGIANQVAKGSAVGGDEKWKGTDTLELMSSLDKVDKFLDHWKQKFDATKESRRDLVKSQKQVQDEINNTRRNMGGHSNGHQAREVMILIESEKGGEAELDVSYVVHDASWTPQYDLRVYTTEEKKLIKVIYDAQIRQNSGEDWTDAELSLSTAIPSVGGSVPEAKALRAHFLRREAEPTSRRRHTVQQAQAAPRVKMRQQQQWHGQQSDDEEEEEDLCRQPVARMAAGGPPRETMMKGRMHTMQSNGMGDMPMMYMSAAPEMMMHMQVAQTQFASSATSAKRDRVQAFVWPFGRCVSYLMAAANSELCAKPKPKPAKKEKMQRSGVDKVSDSVITTNFKIARPTSIPSDNTDHKVNITVLDLTPNFEHETVPSKSTYAYLKAKVLNSSSFPLLAGECSVFLDNNFVAKSQMKAVSPNEDFVCSLGADPAIRVEYKPAKKFHEETGMLTKYTSTITEQHITLHNTRADRAKLRVCEPIPLTTEDKIKITIIKPELKHGEKSPFKLNKDNILECDLSLAPGTKEDFEIKWSIEYPKSEKVEYREY